MGDEYAMKSCLLRFFRAFSEADVHRHRALTLLDPSDSEILINHQAQSQVAWKRRVARRPPLDRLSTALHPKIVVEGQSIWNIALSDLPYHASHFGFK